MAIKSDLTGNIEFRHNGKSWPKVLNETSIFAIKHKLDLLTYDFERTMNRYGRYTFQIKITSQQRKFIHSLKKP